MIITRTPFRITLGGGGTDLPSFYEQHGGYVLTMAINKHMFICLNRRSVADRKIIIRYSQVETVDSIDAIQHPLAREALRLHGIQECIELTSVADMPGNSGLGSSGSYLVGLLTAIRAYRREMASPHEVAEEACHIEMNVLKERVGKQDQYIAALGGFQALEIDQAGKVTSRSLPVGGATAIELASKARIYYTGVQRSATGVLKEQDAATRRSDPAKKNEVVDALLAIKDIGREIESAFQRGDIDRFGELMDEHWVQKRRLSSQVSLTSVDSLYDEVKRRFGVLGGKLIGAGGGGFFMLYVPGNPAALDAFMAAKGMPPVSYFPTLQGATIVHDVASFEDPGR